MPPTGPRWIDYLPLDELVPAARNPKGHDLDGIRASIERLGMVEVAAVMDERTGRIVGGHGRTEVLAVMAAGQDAGAEPPDGVTRGADGRWLVPVYRGWRSRSDADAEVALIGVNQLVTAGGWRRDELAGWMRQAGTDASERERQHPTQKPVAVLVELIEYLTKPGAVVLDPFGGSGTTLIACDQTGRVARLIELAPTYCDVICRRYQAHTGVVPVLEATGQPHDFTTA